MPDLVGSCWILLNRLLRRMLSVCEKWGFQKEFERRRSSSHHAFGFDLVEGLTWKVWVLLTCMEFFTFKLRAPWRIRPERRCRKGRSLEWPSIERHRTVRSKTFVDFSLTSKFQRNQWIFTSSFIERSLPQHLPSLKHLLEASLLELTALDRLLLTSFLFSSLSFVSGKTLRSQTLWRLIRAECFKSVQSPESMVGTVLAAQTSY